LKKEGMRKWRETKRSLDIGRKSEEEKLENDGKKWGRY
jgi:hypothetical protein